MGFFWLISNRGLVALHESADGRPLVAGNQLWAGFRPFGQKSARTYTRFGRMSELPRSRPGPAQWSQGSTEGFASAVVDYLELIVASDGRHVFDELPGVLVGCRSRDGVEIAPRSRRGDEVEVEVELEMSVLLAVDLSGT